MTRIDRADDRESWPDRLRLAFRRRDQPAIALLLGLSLVGMAFYFWHRHIVENGFIDIDKSQRQYVRFTVDINKDPWPAIANLPGIGEQLARQIVDHRQKHGPFAEHAELIQVDGIGPAKLKKIQSMLTPIGVPAQAQH